LSAAGFEAISTNLQQQHHKLTKCLLVILTVMLSTKMSALWPAFRLKITLCWHGCRTYKQMPETEYYHVMGDGLPAFSNSSRTLWEIGNVLISALDDVYYFRTLWGATMDAQPSWQYAYINGPGG
jgi:hypothetical protein